MLLEVEELNVFYGKIQALHGVSLGIPEGKIVAVLGANGAGKTTLLRTISGLQRARSGRIRFLGQQIERADPSTIVRAGLAHVPEGRGMLTEMTVEENLKVGAYLRSNRAEVQHDMDAVLEMFPILKSRLKQPAGLLSGGQQQMLALGRALLSRPKLMMIDEMSLGLAPQLVKEMFVIVREINRTGTTVILVEQNARLALQQSDLCCILENGRVAAQGEASQFLADEVLQALYLGKTTEEPRKKKIGRA